MAPKHHPMPLSGGDRKALNKEGTSDPKRPTPGAPVSIVLADVASV